VIQAGDRGGVRDFSFFKKLIIIILLNKVGFIKLGSADTGYVLTRREARAVGSFKTPISQSGSDHHNSCRVVATATVFLFLRKRFRISWNRPAGVEMVWFETRVCVNLGSGGVGVANANTRMFRKFWVEFEDVGLAVHMR